MGTSERTTVATTTGTGRCALALAAGVTRSPFSRCDLRSITDDGYRYDQRGHDGDEPAAAAARRGRNPLAFDLHG
jgi:hypothetical protein